MERKEAATEDMKKMTSAQERLSNALAFGLGCQMFDFLYHNYQLKRPLLKLQGFRPRLVSNFVISKSKL